jgi:hypothetical protein
VPALQLAADVEEIDVVEVKTIRNAASSDKRLLAIILMY